MAALPRLLPQSFLQSLPNVARALTPQRPRKWARNLASTSSLQPTFPSQPDSNLYESTSDEYSSESNIHHYTTSYPCDPLAHAASSNDLQLATRLLEEYTKAGVNIIHRKDYETLAITSLSRNDFEGYLSWLALYPHSLDSSADGGPKDTGVMRTLTRNRILHNQLADVLVLYASKGWGGHVPTQCIGLLGKYMEVEKFLGLLRVALLRYGAASINSKESELEQARWRSAAITALSKRNKPELAFHLFNQQSSIIIANDEETVAALCRSAKRNHSSILTALRVMITSSIREKIQEEERRGKKLTNAMLTQHAHLLGVRKVTTKRRRLGNSTRKSMERLHGQTFNILTVLKDELVSGERRLHPKAVAWFFFRLSRFLSFTRSRGAGSTIYLSLLNQFHQRVDRLGTEDERTLWATVEMELMYLEKECDSVVHYFRHQLLPLGSPSFIFSLPTSSPSDPSSSISTSSIAPHLQPEAYGDSNGYWIKRLSLPPRKKGKLFEGMLRPSAQTLLTIWQVCIAITLTPLPRSLRSEHDHDLTESEMRRDPTPLVGLFNDFLGIFDRYQESERTFFANQYTKQRFFELFLRAFRRLEDKERNCAWVIKTAQERGVLLDHRTWASYAKLMVDAGDAGMFIRVFSTLEKEQDIILDFSPRSLGDLSDIGQLYHPEEDEFMESEGHDNGEYLSHGLEVFEDASPEGRETEMMKIFNAYVYALKQLLRKRAWREAVELHAVILEAGYIAGSSVSVDRLVWELVEGMRLATRRQYQDDLTEVEGYDTR